MLKRFILGTLVLTLVMALSQRAAQSSAHFPSCADAGNCGGATPSAVATGATTVPGSGSGGTTGSQAAAPARVCHQRVAGGDASDVIPCSFQGGWWLDKDQCYVKLMSPQPPKTDSAWQGNTTGGIYMCVAPGADATRLTRFIWLADQPAEIPGVDPLVLAQKAVAELGLAPIRIGMVPEDKPGYMGLVGLPMWMWVDAPDARTYGPATNTAADGGVSVTITAKVSRTTWDMGNGDTVVCRTVGTIYKDAYGKQDSPDCGYRYSKQGTYTIRATSSWDVSWTASTGQSGTFVVPLTAERKNLVVGEWQVIVTSGR